MHHSIRHLIVSFLLLASLGRLPTVPAAAEPTAPPPPVTVASEQDGVRLEWHAPAEDQRVAGALPALPLVPFGAVQLPAYLVPLRVTPRTTQPGSPITPHIEIEQIEHSTWSGTITRVAPIIPSTNAGEARPALAPAPSQHLPTAPVVVLRAGWLRGERIVVVAITPLYAQGDSLRLASHIVATIPGVVPLPPSADNPPPLLNHLADPAPFLTNIAPPPTPPPPSPPILSR